ncbi:MAG: putative glycoside hydrolase [Candidatus Omnitrophota bacterium]
MNNKWRSLLILIPLFFIGISIFLFSKVIASETGKPRKHIVAYGGSLSKEENIQFIATHDFDIVDTGFFETEGVKKIKLLKPDLIAIGYRDAIAMHDTYDDWNDVDTHEDWFIHDEFGHRLIDDTWNWYLMDPGSEGWRNHYASYVKNQLDNNLMFDGVFADDVQMSLSTTRWHVDIKDELCVVKEDGVSVDVFYLVWTDSKNKINVYTNPEHTGIDYYTGGSFEGNTIVLGTPLPVVSLVYVSYSAKDTNEIRPVDNKVNSWHNDMIGQLQTVKNAIKEKRLIINTNDKNDYINFADGKMNEGFAHVSWYDDGYFKPYYQWKKDMDDLVNVVLRDKIFLAQSGLRKDISSQETAKQMMLYCFGSYLLGMGDSSTFYFENLGYDKITYYPEWDVDLGLPLDSYYLLKEGISDYPQTPPDNLMQNNSFEDGLTNWKINFWDNPAGKAEIDNIEKKEGNSSIKITVSEGGSVSGGAYQHVLLEPDTTYTLSGWVKAENLQSTAYTPAQLYIYPGPGGLSGVKFIGIRPGTYNWIYLNTVFTTGSDTAGSFIYAAKVDQFTGGAVWFDDIKLEKGNFPDYKVYCRDFEKGKVLLNPVYGGAAVELEGRYKTFEGDLISETVFIDGHQAVILIKEDSGDVDADGDVDITDLQLCVNVVLGVEKNPEAVERAKKAAVPVDECDILDVQVIVNRILGD